jgi:hypothetical protein
LFHTQCAAQSYSLIDVQGRTATYGGAIVNFGAMLIRACGFASNAAGSGGAIANMYGTLEMHTCTFTSNQDAEREFYGGAIINWAGTVEMHSSTFTANRAGHGGAISSYYGTMEMHSCTFTSNHASVVRFCRVLPPYTYTPLMHSQNAVMHSQNAGAVWNAFGTTSMRGCTFAANTAGEVRCRPAQTL